MDSEMSQAVPGKIVRIGGGLAFFEDSWDGHPALLRAGVDYLVYDYLAEVTMSILASDPSPTAAGFSPAFLRDIRPFLGEILDRRIKIVTNWGGLDPDAAAHALRGLAAELGRTCRVGVVKGDNLHGRVEALRARDVREMFSGAPLTECALSSVNAYLGGFPIAAALAAGADIVITGRVVDSALSLGPLIHEFDWRPDDVDQLASGTLIGHLLECSTQATGGTFTDWEDILDPADIGNPIAECRADGSFVLTKPEGTGGFVSIGTVSEQMIYEVSDPQAYFAPDVVCDFSAVTMAEVGRDRVQVSAARGYPPTSDYKVCATYSEGWRGQVYQPIVGHRAFAKACRQAEALFERTNRILRNRNAAQLTATHLQVLGADESFGPAETRHDAREVVAMMTVEHAEPIGVEVFLKEQISAISSMAPGTTMSLGGLTGRGVMPLMRVFNFLLPKAEVTPIVTVEGEAVAGVPADHGGFSAAMLVRPHEPEAPDDVRLMSLVPLRQLAWGRSGDKGDLFNVGVFARRAHYFPYLAAALTADLVRDRFAHLTADPDHPVDRYLLPGACGLNFVVHRALGGGGSVCARLDPLAKTMAQILLAIEVPVSAAIRDELARSPQR